MHTVSLAVMGSAIVLAGAGPWWGASLSSGAPPFYTSPDKGDRSIINTVYGNCPYGIQFAIFSNSRGFTRIRCFQDNSPEETYSSVQLHDMRNTVWQGNIPSAGRATCDVTQTLDPEVDFYAYWVTFKCIE